MNDFTDQVIISKVLAGNTPAYSELVNKYSSMAFTLAYNIILNREDAEEAAQDAFIKAFHSLHSFKQESKFSTWLYRIVINTSLNKKKQRKLFVSDITDKLTEEPDEAYSLPKYEKEDMKQFVRAAVNALPDNERICITMYYLNELSVNEIADLTGITTANIKVLLHRGRKHLYDKLNSLLKTELDNLR